MIQISLIIFLSLKFYWIDILEIAALLYANCQLYVLLYLVF